NVGMRMELRMVVSYWKLEFLIGKPPVTDSTEETSGYTGGFLSNVSICNVLTDFTEETSGVYHIHTE
ncbi:hypothetical protein U1Q18_052203, partial [Sarracenia purpurea var. burkii]